jgi:hypothetical protein
MRRFLIGLVCAALLASFACTNDDDGDRTQASPTAEGTATPEPTPCVLEDASTKERTSETSDEVAQLADLRWDGHARCPRVVFEFEDELANYTIKYTDDIRDCGEGKEPETADWDADSFLSVRMYPAGGPINDEGETAYKGPRDIEVDGPILKHIKDICDYEAVFEWIIALDEKRPFAVTTFTDPARLAIDISDS